MKRMALTAAVLFLLAFLFACSMERAGSDRTEDDTEKYHNSTASSDTLQEEESIPEENDREENDLKKKSEKDGKNRLLYMGQASIRITTADGKVIYIDPYAGTGYEPTADLILVTHSHYDHSDTDKVRSRNPDCRTITWKEALDGGEHRIFDLGYARVEAVEAGYNRWHNVKECVGYIVTLPDGITVYVTGDTSMTEQMPALKEKHIDYAFYCCDGAFNMDLEEAAECASLVGAAHDIPYHVLAQEGVYFDRKRAEQFDSENLLIIDEGEEIELESSFSKEEKREQSGMRTEKSETDVNRHLSL